MQTTPKAQRLHIGIFGRANVGKSSFLNMISGQDIAIVSPVPGTTTDVVEKTMELLPVGPVVFLDTAGFDDATELGPRRISRTKKAFERAEVVVLVAQSGVWTEYEETIAAMAAQAKAPLIVAINKTDIAPADEAFLAKVRAVTDKYFSCVSSDLASREQYLNAFKTLLIQSCPEDFIKQPPILADIVPPGSMVVLIVPIDMQAPKGRLILPQVQTIRDALDAGTACLVVRETEYAAVLKTLNTPPSLVVCDSQVVDKMVSMTPPEIRCTTFSILYARLKGDLPALVRGAAALAALKPGQKVLIAESCSHHPTTDDIGRIKIPRWLERFAGHAVQADVACGRDFPDNLSDYKAVIHCGSCMFTRRDMMLRIQKAAQAGVAITNYGVAISFLQGVLPRVLQPFPDALAAYEEAVKKTAV